MGQHKYNPKCQLAKEGKLPPKPKKMGKREAERLLYARCKAILYGPNFVTDNNDGGKWIPVTERLPEICGYPVLMAAVNKYGQKKIVKGFTNYECPVEFCTNEKEYDLCWHCWEVTHWMHLPEQPKGE